MNILNKNIYLGNLIARRFRNRFFRSSNNKNYNRFNRKELCDPTNSLKSCNSSKYPLFTLLSVAGIATVSLEDENADVTINDKEYDENSKINDSEENDDEIDLDQIKSESLRTIVKYYQYLLEETIVSKDNEYNEELERVRNELESTYFELLQNTQKLEIQSREIYISNLNNLIDESHDHQFDPNDIIDKLETLNSKLSNYREQDEKYTQIFKSFDAFLKLHHHILFGSTHPYDQIYNNFIESIHNLPHLKNYVTSLDFDSSLLHNFKDTKIEFLDKYNKSIKYCLIGESDSEFYYQFQKFRRYFAKLTSTIPDNDVNELNLQRLESAKNYLENGKYSLFLNEIEKLEGKPKEYMEPLHDNIERILIVNDYLSFIVTKFVQIFEKHSSNKKLIK